MSFQLNAVARRISYLRGQKAHPGIAIWRWRPIENWRSDLRTSKRQSGNDDDEIAIIEAARQLILARDKTRREIRFHVPRDRRAT